MRWRLEVSRDRIDRAPLAFADVGDWLMLARGGAYGTASGYADPSVHRIARQARSVVVIFYQTRGLGARPVLTVYDASESGLRSLREAARQAAGQRRQLLVLLAPSAAGEAAALTRWARERGLRLRLAYSARDDAGTLLALVRREHPGMLVMARNDSRLAGRAGERVGRVDRRAAGDCAVTSGASLPPTARLIQIKDAPATTRYTAFESRINGEKQQQERCHGST